MQGHGLIGDGSGGSVQTQKTVRIKGITGGIGQSDHELNLKG